jgi:hypothetical protein
MTDIELSYALLAESEPESLPVEAASVETASLPVEVEPLRIGIAPEQARPIQPETPPVPAMSKPEAMSKAETAQVEPTSRALEQTINGLRQFLSGRDLAESEAALRRMYARSARWHTQDDTLPDIDPSA